jgi:uncharacterized protein (TIGR00725 family)
MNGPPAERAPDAGRHAWPPYIAVCGPDPASDDLLDAAERIGRGLAERGAVLVCGGHGGVMEAAARGAASAGGVVVGILPGSDRTEGNDHLTVAIPTGLGELRNGLIVRAADAVVAVGGAFGTLSEIALALKTGVPVVGLATWELIPGDGGGSSDPMLRVRTAADAVDEALRAASRQKDVE